MNFINMKKTYFLVATLFALIFCCINANAQGSCADGSYQWSDVATIFQNNGCNSATCHGGAASGLDLTTFNGFNTGGTKCGTEIQSGATLVDIIQVGGVVCANGTVSNAMNNNTGNTMSAADIATIQAYVDGGAFEFCPGTPLDDGVCVPPSTIGSLTDPGQTTLCSDGSDAVTFAMPAASLPDVQIVVEINGVISTISDDGSFDTSTLMDGDEVCYTAFTFDLAAINSLLTTASQLCPILDCDNTFGIPGVNQAIDDLVTGANDGMPGLNDLQEALDFAGSFGNPIGSVQSAGATLDALNAQIGGLLGNVCYATSAAVCLAVVECGPSTCPTVILNDANLPNLPPAVCAEDLLSLCFDVNVDEDTFDPTLIQFGYDLTIDGAPSTVVLNTIYNSGAAIDPNATGQLCFEATVPVGTDPCVPYELSLEIVEVFYNDPGCPNNFVAYDLNITNPAPIMQMGDDLNALIPLLGIAGLNPILVQIYPNPNWTATVTQAPACDGATLGIIEIYAADGTLCETLTDVGTAGMDACPPTDAILPETLYENNTTFTDANGMEQPNPCAVSITIPEQTVACEDQCIMCPAVVNVIPPNNICPDAGAVIFCVEFDMVVDANTVLTVEGVSVDGSAGGMQICVDIPFTAPFDPCNGVAIDYTATAICNGIDLLAGTTWLSTQILPITDPACGGIAGCMDATACNFNPMAVCDDPENPCISAPVCNTNPCIGDTEIVDPADPCQCIVDQPQVLGCTDVNACNYNMAANCDDATCDLGNTMCPDSCNPPNPDDGCDLTTDTFDAATCTVTNTPPDPDDACDLTTDVFDAATCTITNTPNCAAGETFDSVNCLCTTDPVPGCTNACADNYNPDATTDDGSCMFPNPDDGCDLTVDSYDDVNCVVINEAPNPDDGCDLTTDAFDAATCMITNTPSCAAGETFDAANCACIIGGTPGCLDPCDPNFDENATMDDPSLCAGYDTTCNTDCLMGDLTIWDASTCSCVVDVVTVLGCTDSTADNYDPAANCDDSTCTTGPCEDMITGSVVVEETGCSPAGIEVTIYDSTGAILGTATTDADGNYSLMGLYPCGNYTAELTANVPSCYSDSGGITGPIAFTVNGDGTADGVNFTENPQVPTLSQWGLIILALLMMSFGALRLTIRQLIYTESVN